MPVNTGKPSSCLMCCSTSSPASIPWRRKLWIEERFALSNDDLKTKSRSAASARCEHPRALSKACSGLSTTQGPAMIVSRPSPNVASPTENAFTLPIDCAEYTSFALVRLVGGGGPRLAEPGDVDYEPARRRWRWRVAVGPGVGRAGDRMMFEPQALRCL